ncbi:MAG: hypothetical protein CM15mP78_15620 [Candidatus Poseidoniales archaeon]|nr:MAG: hypothetical protein CM15mP78_15620 [Candidatus Poseidoniales archaeon]
MTRPKKPVMLRMGRRRREGLEEEDSDKTQKKNPPLFASKNQTPDRPRPRWFAEPSQIRLNLSGVVNNSTPLGGGVLGKQREGESLGASTNGIRVPTLWCIWFQLIPTNSTEKVGNFIAKVTFVYQSKNVATIIIVESVTFGSRTRRCLEPFQTGGKNPTLLDDAFVQNNQTPTWQCPRQWGPWGECRAEGLAWGR